MVALNLLTASLKGQYQFVFVDHGKPVVEIGLHEQAGLSEHRAAELLQTWIRRISGAELPIVRRPSPGHRPAVEIGFRSVDGDRAADLPPDGFVLTTEGDKLRIEGGSGKGPIYAVVHLLETYMGCRVYSPTYATWPQSSRVAIAEIADRDAPVNTFRAVNGEFVGDRDYMDWQRLDSTADVYGAGYYVHTAARLVPPGEYFKAHPEYFALIDGQRSPLQLCPTDPAIPGLIIAKLRKEMAAQPDKQVWSVSQNDNESYCHCPRCLAMIADEGSPAGPVIRLVNQVAAAFPDKTISTLAYEWSRSAPKLVRPAPNVQVMLCSIEANRSRPIFDDPSDRSFVRDIEAWSKICHNIYLWDYVVNFHDHVSPFPNLDVLAPNIRGFVANGVRQHFQQSNDGVGHEFSELKAYLIGRLLWNPAADPAVIIDEFTRGFYGAAAPQIIEYQHRLEEALYSSGSRLDIFESPVKHERDYLSVENVAAYNALFDKAEAAVAGSPAHLEHVKVARLSIQRAMLEIAKDDVYGPRGLLTKVAGKPVVRPEMRLMVEEFYATCRRNHVRSLAEKKGSTPEAFYTSLKRIFDLQVAGNLAYGRPVTADPPPSAKYSRGDISMLTDGIVGGEDYASQWVGWDGVDFTVEVDLGAGQGATSAITHSLWSASDWILHPRSVQCSVSADGKLFIDVGTRTVGDAQQREPHIRTYKFHWSTPNVRYVRLSVDGTKRLPSWSPYAGGSSWVFLDEIIVR